MTSAAGQRILVVDDEPRMIGFIRMNLELEGYQVLAASNGLEALDEVRKNIPDLIILDVMMPELDGFETLRMLREFSNVPVIMLTAKGEEDDRVYGLELGADDYVTKPFSAREVTSRVKAVLRRSHPEPGEEKLIAGPIVLRPASHKTTINERDLHLTPNEFELLKVLMSQPERVFTRSDLVSKIQGYDFDGYDRTIDSHIKNLRKKIDEHLNGQMIIRTVYGIGYTFNIPRIEQ